ncbi:LysR family transcriptional regulator [Streptosporangium sp. NPDC002607]
MSATVAQLRVFTAVITNGGFGVAAEELGMSQSAVSHALAALERALGAPLVLRHGGVGPTALGATILPHAQAALASVAAIDEAVSAHLGQHTGVVRVAAPPTVCCGLLPQLMRTWRAELPGVEVQVFEGDDDELSPWLETGVVDAAILVDPVPPPPAHVVVGRDAFHAVVRADHPLAGQEHITMAELVEDPLLVSKGGCEPQTRILCSLAGVPYAPAQHVRELGTLIGMIAAGIGVSTVPDLGRGLLTPGLIMIPLKPSLTRALVLTGPLTRPPSPLVDALLRTAPEAPAPPVAP